MEAFEAAETSPDDPESRLPILLANEQSALEVDFVRLEAAVRSVLDLSPFQTGEISVAIVDDPTIHELNRQYLQHDYATDVLSFVLESAGTHLEGQLVLSADTAVREAEVHRWKPEEELLLYAIHGALHLVGYLDQSASDRDVMHRAEAEHLQKLGVLLPAGASRWSDSMLDVENHSREIER